MTAKPPGHDCLVGTAGPTIAGALLGARVLTPAGDPGELFTNARVSPRVLLCPAGPAGSEPW